MAGIVDSFNRVDNALSLGTTSDGNATWTTQTGTCGINTNQAYPSALDGTGFAIATVPGSADGSVEAVMAFTDVQTGPIFRFVDISNYWAVKGFTGSGLGGNSGLYQRASGTNFHLAQFTIADGDLVHVDFTGDVITCFVNGTDVATTTNSSFDTATLVGIHFGSLTNRLDSFAYSPPPSAPPRLTVINQAVQRAANW